MKRKPVPAPEAISEIYADDTQLRCPSCGYAGFIDTFECLLAEEDCVFCPACVAQWPIEEIVMPRQEPGQATLF